MAFISHVATPLGQPDVLADLIALLTAGAAQTLAVALDARGPRLPVMSRRFPGRRDHTRRYTVAWRGDPGSDEPDGRLLFPEAALL